MSKRPEQVTKVCQLPSRRREGHKGDYGRVLVVGGSRGMIGAVALASNAALRGGAGLVTFAAPESIQQAVAVLCPCATSIPLACKADGDFVPEAMRQLAEAAETCDVIALGPGLGLAAQRQNMVRVALEQTRPLILDADGLNNLARIDGWPARRRCPLVLTPHVGEFAYLTGKTAQQIQSARQDAAVAAAREWADQQALAGPPLVCVLKGAGTVVTDGRRVYVNDTGNPGMATGGSGDVLTGLIAAMIGQKLEPFDAACLAVRVHGRAGDLAADEKGQASLIATDLLDYLPAAMKEAIEQ
jgi:ADP-dependent NAD(P)H-hydrate dehydratase